MSKQTAEKATAVGAEEQSSTDVADNKVDRATLQREQAAAKERQKSRLGALEPEALIELYRQMILIRRFEEKSAEVYSAGKIGGFCHL